MKPPAMPSYMPVGKAPATPAAATPPAPTVMAPPGPAVGVPPPAQAPVLPNNVTDRGHVTSSPDNKLPRHALHPRGRGRGM